MNHLRSVLVVVNPASGKSGFTSKLNRLLDLLHAEGIHTAVFVTQRDGGHGRLRAYIQRRGPFSDIAVIGGDGTLNYAVNESHQSGIPLSIISNGRGNDSVKSLHGAMSFEAQAGILIHGEVKHFDLGLCNQRLFVNGVGLGFDGAVVEHMLRSKKVLGGHIAYLLTVLRLLGGYRENRIDYIRDGIRESGEAFMMTISNGTTFGGGFVINPKAKPDDGLLDICLIRPISILKRFRYLPLLRTGEHIRLSEVELSLAGELEISETLKVVAHLDGEFIGHPPYSIRVLPGALSLRVPPSE